MILVTQWVKLLTLGRVEINLCRARLRRQPISSAPVCIVGLHYLDQRERRRRDRTDVLAGPRGTA